MQTTSQSGILILGASSAIALASARVWAKKGAKFFLVGRSEEKLSLSAKDLQLRGASLVQTLAADLNDVTLHGKILAAAKQSLGEIDITLVAWGLLGDNDQAKKHWQHAAEIIQSNFLGQASILTLLANQLEVARRSAAICVISSVSGERGRQSNYVYGSAKGALSLFAQGLRNRLARAKINVVTILPGFVDTPMTSHIAKGPLFASPKKVGEGICRAVACERSVVYLPGFWRLIMLVIKSIPECIFKRLKL